MEKTLLARTRTVTRGRNKAEQEEFDAKMAEAAVTLRHCENIIID